MGLNTAHRLTHTIRHPTQPPRRHTQLRQTHIPMRTSIAYGHTSHDFDTWARARPRACTRHSTCSNNKHGDGGGEESSSGRKKRRTRVETPALNSCPRQPASPPPRSTEKQMKGAPHNRGTVGAAGSQHTRRDSPLTGCVCNTLRPQRKTGTTTRARARPPPHARCHTPLIKHGNENVGADSVRVTGRASRWRSSSGSSVVKVTSRLVK